MRLYHKIASLAEGFHIPSSAHYQPAELPGIYFCRGRCFFVGKHIGFDT
jgi:hypothetical protein